MSICDNDRGVKGKVIDRVFLNYCLPVAKELLPKSLDCFHPAAPWTLLNLIKAFDSINLTGLWNTLLKRAYPHNSSVLALWWHEICDINQFTTEPLSLMTSSKQGCNSFQTPFLISLAVLLHLISRKHPTGTEILLRTWDICSDYTPEPKLPSTSTVKPQSAGVRSWKPSCVLLSTHSLKHSREQTLH